MAKILVAEDDKAVSAFVSRALQHRGHEVTVVPDGSAISRVLEITEVHRVVPVSSSVAAVLPR